MVKAERIYFPNLDGLRFFCFLFVFLYHSFSTNKPEILNNRFYNFFANFLFDNGNLGVNFFFVLSGFLITYLLIKEEQLNGKIDIKNFYIRRILRIWPLFYFCIIFGFVIFPFLKEFLGMESNENAHLIYYILFINNFDVINNNTLPDSSILGVLWSVAIEEQFYLFWPLLLRIIGTKNYPYIFLIILTFSLLFRFIYINNNNQLEMNTFSCISDMIIGGLGAYLCNYNKEFIPKIRALNKYTIAILYTLTIIIFLFRKDLFYHNWFLILIERVCISFIFLMIILEQNFSNNSLFKLSNYTIISKLGNYTYGLYCLHFIGLLIAMVIMKATHLNNYTWQILIIEPLIALPISVLISYLSYTYYEYPFLKLKNRFSYIIK